jgi:hypothetical protein
MRYARALLLAAGFLIFAATPRGFSQEAPLSPDAKLQMEVDALSSLNDLSLTSDQLSSLKDMASDTAGALSQKPTPMSDIYKSAIVDLRVALLSKDADKIDSAEDKVDDLADKEDPDSQPDIDQSSAAKSKAEALLKMLSVTQVANFVSQNGGDLDDPAQTLLDAMHQCRGMSEQDFQDLRDDTSQELGIYAAGVNTSKTPAIIGKINRFLTKVHKLSNDEYSDQQSTLEDEARKLVGGMDPVNTLRHWLQDEMADLLSNPELIRAIDEYNSAGNK